MRTADVTALARAGYRRSPRMTMKEGRQLRFHQSSTSSAFSPVAIRGAEPAVDAADVVPPVIRKLALDHCRRAADERMVTGIFSLGPIAGHARGVSSYLHLSNKSLDHDETPSLNSLRSFVSKQRDICGVIIGRNQNSKANNPSMNDNNVAKILPRILQCIGQDLTPHASLVYASPVETDMRVAYGVFKMASWIVHRVNFDTAYGQPVDPPWECFECFGSEQCFEDADVGRSYD